MIYCYLEATVNPESQCAKCCMYCDDKECVRRCHLVEKYSKQNENIEDNIIQCCPSAFEVE